MSKETITKPITKIANHVNRVAPAGVPKKVAKKKNQGQSKRIQRRKRTILGKNVVRPVLKENPEWIESNFSMRVCNRFTENKKKTSPDPEDPFCHCGKKKSCHEPQYLQNDDPSKPWTVETHTKKSPTKAYGEIEFVGAAGSGQGQQKLRKFVCADYKTNPKTLMDLIQKQWNLGQPKLLISVTGGAINFPLSSSLKDVFRKGLIKAALSTGAWIITGGSNSGVMKYVGEAVRDYAIAEGGSATTSIVAIGIATWGILDQQEALTNDDQGKGKLPGRPASYRMDQQKRTGPVRLDPNHTHFILVDDGTTGNFGVEIKLRSDLEKQISEQKVTRESDERLNVPTVCVVVQGGPNTIQTVYEAVQNGTPCLIIAGSGRAADILAYAFDNVRSTTREYEKNGVKTKKQTYFLTESVQVKIAEMLYKEFRDKDLDLHQNRIKECIKQPSLINVYKLDAGRGVSTDIDGAILHALLKANKGNRIDQLQLALVWNRVDVAKREIFTDDNDLKMSELNESVRYAIEHNLPSFLELFIENGVSMNDYLTEEELTILYSRIKQTTLLSYMLKDNKKKDGRNKLTLWVIGQIIQQLTMDTYKPLYLSDEERFNQEYPLTAVSGKKVLRKSDNFDHSKPQFDPIRELFLYAILLNRREMARNLWERINEAIAAALTASKMLKAMADKESDPDQKENMMEHANIYEELAIGVLNECYEQEEDRTNDMMIREMPNWGQVTCLTMAVQAQNRKFIAQSAVQNLLTEIWMGKISDENNYWKLWLYMFCPPMVALDVWFREDEHREKCQQFAVTANELDDSEGIGENHEMVVRVDNGGAAPPANANGEHRRVSGESSYIDPGDVDIHNSGQRLSVWQRLRLFYNAPIVKFRFNVLAYFAFLFLFSFIILTEFEEDQVRWKEWFLIGWVVTLYLEEFRQIAHGESNSWMYRFYHWINDFWNIVDVATLLLFGIGVALRAIPGMIGPARIVLALDLMGFYMRLLQSFSVSKNLGPKLIMIARMMVDLLFFICILAVFLISYGIASQAIMFPNVTDPLTLFKGIFYQSYFQMYGELFLEDIQPETCTLEDPCPEYSWMGILLLSIYMMLSNVLLLNLLIAMFSYTFSNVQDNTDELWKFQRYEVINEYFNRPAIPPPLILISLIYFFFRFCIKLFCCGCCPGWTSPKLMHRLKDEEVKQLVLWEGINADNFISKENFKSQHNLDERMKVTGDRVQTMVLMMEKLLGNSEQTTRMPPGGKSVDDRLSKIEHQLVRTNEAMEWIMNSLIKNKLSSEEELPDMKHIDSSSDPEESDSNENEDGDYEVTTLEELVTRVHIKSRKSPYPGTAMRRFHVSDKNVPWSVHYPAYKPVKYTHPSVLGEGGKPPPHWADDDLMVISVTQRPRLQYNKFDTKCNYNRQSHMGEYHVQDGLPVNPKGRTGVIGRGILGRFGPNHAADPIVTRWKRKPNGEKETEDGRAILEFIAIQRRDNKQWAIPGGMVEPGHKVSQTLLREFREEALGELDKTEQERKQIKDTVDQLFHRGTEVYKGYVDDPRNTDNAWMETVAMNFHDDDGHVFAQLDKLFQAGDDAQGVRWQRISSEIPLFASHTAMLTEVAKIRNAAF